MPRKIELVPGDEVLVVTIFEDIAGMGQHNSTQKHRLLVNDDLSMGGPKGRKLYLDPHQARDVANGKSVSVGMVGVELYDPRKEYPIGDAWRPGAFGRIADSDRQTLIRLASSMPKGSEERKAILAGLRAARAKSLAIVVDTDPTRDNQPFMELSAKTGTKGERYWQVRKNDWRNGTGMAPLPALVELAEMMLAGRLG